MSSGAGGESFGSVLTVDDFMREQERMQSLLPTLPNIGGVDNFLQQPPSPAAPLDITTFADLMNALRTREDRLDQMRYRDLIEQTAANRLQQPTADTGLVLTVTPGGTTAPIPPPRPSDLNAVPLPPERPFDLGMPLPPPRPGDATGQSAQNDERIRIHALPGADSIYGSGVSGILSRTRGMIFPYTPSVNISQPVDYDQMNMTHSNTAYYSYARTQNTNITISGKFTVQNQTEGQYALACLRFLQTVSRMHFGAKDESKGLPPPVLGLSGYGTRMFHNTRVIVLSHSYTFDENVDTVRVNVEGGTVRLPALFSLQVTLVTQPTAKMMRDTFTLEEYRNGSLLDKGFF